MYTLMSAIRSVLKEFRLPKRLWDEIVQVIADVNNRTICQSTNGITPYERVSKVIPFITHLYALGCQCYIHFLDTTICHTMNGRGQKDIMV